MHNAAALAATAGGWELVAHSPHTAVLRVYCRGGWVGVVVIDARTPPTTVTATLARPVERRPLFSAKHPPARPLAVWLYERVAAQFAALQSVSVPRPQSRWLASEHDMIAAPVEMAAVARRTPVLSARRMSPGYWRFLCARPATTIIVRMTRWALVLSVGSAVYTESHRGIYDPTSTPAWHAAPDVLGVAQWLFTSIRQSPEAPSPLPPWVDLEVAGQPPADR
jgi:hypothetical protein